MAEIDYSLAMCLMAALPIVLMFVMMLGFHWGASGAASLSMLASMLVAVVFYRSDLNLVAVESAKGIWNSFSILIVVWPAILIYEVTAEANAFDAIRGAIEKFSPNMLLRILAIGFVFAGFLQGVTGFGVPVAVIAPLLIAMGIRPVWAVVIPLLGQAWGNTYGTLAAAWDALVGQAEISGSLLSETALWTAVFLCIVNAATGLVICWSYGKGQGLKKGLPAVLIISAIQGGGEILMSQFNTSLCCFLPACIALAAVFVLGRLPVYRERWEIADSPMMNPERTASAASGTASKLSFNQAFLPYYVLTAVTLAVLLISPVKHLCSGVVLSMSFPETSTPIGVVNEATSSYSSLVPFTNSGVFLLIAAVIGWVWFAALGCYWEGSTKRIIFNLLKKTIPSSLTIITLVVMSRVMTGSGQIMVLAQGTAAVAGAVYGVLCPFVGMLGTFVTGSNVSSNVMFTRFQQGITGILGKNEAILLAAQTAGASLGSVISPSKIILGTTTAGILGKEESVMKKVLPFALVLCAAVGLISLLMA